MYTHRRSATAHSTQRTPACRFAIDRTPLQRMLMAAVLHSHLSRGGPGGPPAIPGGLVPPRAADDAKADAYAEFHSVGRLPTDLFEDSTTAASGPGWHGESAAGRVTHVEERAVVDYQKSFEVVRAPATPFVCTRHGHAVLCCAATAAAWYITLHRHSGACHFRRRFIRVMHLAVVRRCVRAAADARPAVAAAGCCAM